MKGASGTTVPRGTCMVHGAYHGPCCPSCVTMAEPFIVTQPNVRIVQVGTPAGVLSAA